MKRLFSGSVILFVLNSCTPGYNNYPVTDSSSNREREYLEVLKTYKSETAEVLTYLLNGASPEESKTALTVENTSSCNMVLTVSGNNYFKRIPIGKGKIGSVMLPKNQTYQLSGMVCQSSYQTSKFISNSYSIKL
ncbi:MAG: competence protein ComL [Chryseobacterium sp.]|nr:MAG: competence protein ComL [Chryseobacterium sp.]